MICMRDIDCGLFKELMARWFNINGNFASAYWSTFKTVAAETNTRQELFNLQPVSFPVFSVSSTSYLRKSAKFANSNSKDISNAFRTKGSSLLEPLQSCGKSIFVTIYIEFVDNIRFVKSAIVMRHGCYLRRF